MEHKVTQEQFIDYVRDFYAARDVDAVIRIERESVIRLNKGGRVSPKTHKFVPENPLNGCEVTMDYEYGYRFTSKSYVDLVKEAMQRNGIDPDTYEEAEDNFTSPYRKLDGFKNKNMLKINKDTGEVYIVCYEQIGGDSKEGYCEYYVDGKPATDEELEIIDQYSPAKGVSKNQAENGLSYETEVKYKQIPLSTVKRIELGRETFVF